MSRVTEILMGESIAARLKEMHQTPQKANVFDVHFVAGVCLQEIELKRNYSCVTH